MSIGLKGSGCDTELEVIAKTEKAYQVCNDAGNIMWMPKMAFDSCKELTNFGVKIYKEKCAEFKQKETEKLEKEKIKLSEQESKSKKEINFKHDHFIEELNYIKNDKIREWTIKAIDALPDYIFVIPASSTGNHHPSYALGKGGVNKVNSIIDFINQKHKLNIQFTNIYTSKPEGINIINEIILSERKRNSIK